MKNMQEALMSKCSPIPKVRAAVPVAPVVREARVAPAVKVPVAPAVPALKV